MKVRVGVNGLGRIGRAVVRGILERHDSPVEVVAVNDVAPVEVLAHLLRYDSTYGRWAVPVEADEAAGVPRCPSSTSTPWSSRPGCCSPRAAPGRR